MNKIAYAKLIAAILLLVSLFVPFATLNVSDEFMAKCTNDPNHHECSMPDFYAGENIVEFTREVISGKQESYIYKYLFLYSVVFILPFISIIFKPIPQSIIILLGVYPSAYFLHIFIGKDMVWHWHALIGTWLSFTSWLIWLSVSLLTVWRLLPHNKSLKDAP